MTELSTTTRSTPTGPVLEIAGDLDFHTAPRAREALLGLTPGPGELLVIDLSALTFCDSSGITVLVAARNHALSHQAQIALAAVPSVVARTFKITGLTQIFPTHPTAQDATAQWAARPGSARPGSRT
ncbi:STAS domain-containing protein [Streptacidiphilus sp. P02-A3a]|uniref:STAS domain-containing protein n=1 Tax=Streptacidiphilus sp. P02-A3a TaxID=2704468 RepID=UPI0015FA4682|nr:STAS domain-containing protein [Streptacidiphilus sp. P02-A3a]QMU69313.1 STAS domain-containing protein [Streptacidiphilus sp. P02-A3a]